jgi:hypothetical protein
MRARNIKPGFFTNELLGTYDPIVSLLFAGLWCLADKDGRLEDRPLRIKAELFPYRDSLDVNGYLTVLERDGFITRYEVGGKGYIQVEAFERHQSPHHTEKARGYPANPESLQGSGCKEALAPLSNREKKVPTRSDSLIHGFTDSLIQEHPAANAPGPVGKKAPKAAQPSTLPNWIASLVNEDAIPSDDPIVREMDAAGIPVDFQALYWQTFKADMTERGKRQKDWRAHFRNAVRRNWYKLWYFDGQGQCRLTTAGEQAMRTVGHE